MTRPVRIYLSGPITRGSRNEHFFRACEAEKALMLAGFAPLNPMRSIILPFAWESCVPHEMWLRVDKAWIEVCDAVLRLAGESEGGDEECAHARTCGIPVYYCNPQAPFERALDHAVRDLERFRRTTFALQNEEAVA